MTNIYNPIDLGGNDLIVNRILTGIKTGAPNGNAVLNPFNMNPGSIYSPQIAAVGGGGGSMVFAGTFSPQNAALWSLSNWTGTSTGETPFNRIAINGDSVAAGTNQFVEALQVTHHFGGSAAVGGRHALVVALQQTAATGNAGTSTDPFHVGLNVFVDVSFNEGGTSLVFKNTEGNFFAYNPVVRTHSGATNLSGVVNTEFNIQCLTGSSTYGKVGLQIVKETGDAVQGSAVDVALRFADQAGVTVGWKNIIEVGSGFATWPADPNGSIFATRISQDYNTNSSSTLNGVDFVQTPFTGYAFRSRGFSVDGSGTAQIGTGLISSNSSGLVVDIKGSVGTGIAVSSGGTLYNVGDVVIDAYGGVYKITAAPAGIVSTLSIIQAPFFNSGTTPSNPIDATLNTSVNPLGSGLTINITWSTTRTTLSLNPSGGNVVSNLPSSNPHVVGALWNNSGVVNVSAG